MSTLAPKEAKLFRTLTTPSKIQDFLNTLSMRSDEKEPIVRSPREVLRLQKASCMEGALLAYAVFRFHKQPAYLLDLRVGSRTRDVDHVVTLFKKDGYWGAVSKTAHAVLRYREPIYTTPRELAMSYFHEYFTDDGAKNLRAYSAPFDVFKYAGMDWVTSTDDLYEIAAALDESPHTEILTKKQAQNLRRADMIERQAGKLKE